jgi:hypothetical protein
MIFAVNVPIALVAALAAIRVVPARGHARRHHAIVSNPRLRRSAMSTRVSKTANVIVPVADQDRALRFYTEALGLEKRVDVPFGEGNRWIEVVRRSAPSMSVQGTPTSETSTSGVLCR